MVVGITSVTEHSYVPYFIIMQMPKPEAATKSDSSSFNVSMHAKYDLPGNMFSISGEGPNLMTISSW